METKLIKKEKYNETNGVARSPTLQTVLMVEKFIDENSGEYKKQNYSKISQKSDVANIPGHNGVFGEYT